jgi:hypothetical protein
MLLKLFQTTTVNTKPNQDIHGKRLADDKKKTIVATITPGPMRRCSTGEFYFGSL